MINTVRGLKRDLALAKAYLLGESYTCVGYRHYKIIIERYRLLNDALDCMCNEGWAPKLLLDKNGLEIGEDW